MVLELIASGDVWVDVRLYDTRTWRGWVKGMRRRMQQGLWLLNAGREDDAEDAIASRAMMCTIAGLNAWARASDIPKISRPRRGHPRKDQTTHIGGSSEAKLKRKIPPLPHHGAVTHFAPFATSITSVSSTLR